MSNIYGELATGSDFEIDLDDILDNLQFMVMAIGGVKKDKWEFNVDVIYLDLEADKNSTAYLLNFPVNVYKDSILTPLSHVPFLWTRRRLLQQDFQAGGCGTGEVVDKVSFAGGGWRANRASCGKQIREMFRNESKISVCNCPGFSYYKKIRGQHRGQAAYDKHLI